MDFELDGITVDDTIHSGKIYSWSEWYDHACESWGYQVAEQQKGVAREILFDDPEIDCIVVDKSDLPEWERVGRDG